VFVCQTFPVLDRIWIKFNNLKSWIYLGKKDITTYLMSKLLPYHRIDKIRHQGAVRACTAEPLIAGDIHFQIIRPTDHSPNTNGRRR
jgi:hypothetical protein